MGPDTTNKKKLTIYHVQLVKARLRKRVRKFRKIQVNREK